MVISTKNISIGTRQPCDKYTGDKMPKLKTKSSLKKRFSKTSSGKIKFKPSGKRHGMSKRSNKFVRKSRKSAIMTDADSALISHMMPYNK